MTRDDKQLLVTNENTESSPVYSEGELQTPKFFGCCKAPIGWTIWYSIKTFFVITKMLVLYFLEESVKFSLHAILKEQDLAEYENYLNVALTKAYWSANIGNVLFLIGFVSLMIGIHGEYQKRHRFFFPMIILEWVQVWIPVLLLIIGILVSFVIGGIDENGNRTSYRDNTKTVAGMIVSLTVYVPMQALYIMIPLYLNRFRKHVKTFSTYSNFV